MEHNETIVQYDCWDHHTCLPKRGLPHETLDFDEWDIKEPRGIPNCDSSNTSPLWVLEWMNMEHVFLTSLPGVMFERVVRMKVTVSLFTGDHNACKHKLLSNAYSYWKEFTSDEPQ